MKLIRRLLLASMKWNVIFRSKHIKGKTNIVADLLFSISEGTNNSTLAIANPCRYSSSPVESLHVQDLQLLRAGLSESARKSYRRNYSTALNGQKILLSHYPT